MNNTFNWTSIPDQQKTDVVNQLCTFDNYRPIEKEIQRQFITLNDTLFSHLRQSFYLLMGFFAIDILRIILRNTGLDLKFTIPEKKIIGKFKIDEEEIDVLRWIQMIILFRIGTIILTWGLYYVF